jgi:hypothetical protein
MTLPEQERVQSLIIPPSGWIRDFVDTYAPFVEAPREALAGMAYTTLSAAVGWRSWLQWADSKEPLTLFTVLRGESASAHKTTVLRIGTGIARDANKIYRELAGCTDEDPDLIKIVSGGHTSQAGLLDKLAPQSPEEATRWDVDNPPGILVEWDELGDLVVDRNGYSFLQETRQMLLRLYGGFQPGSQTRSNPVPASRCAVSLIGTITSDEWEERLSAGAVTGGMMGRLFAIPTGEPPEWHPRPRQVPRQQRNDLVDWLAQLGALPYPTWGPVAFDDDAAEYWDAWYRTHKNEIRALNRDDPVLAKARGTIFNRYQAIAQKFGGLQAISMCNPADRYKQPSPIIDASIIEAACAYTDMALEQTSRIAVEVMEAPDERFTRRVVETLKKAGGPMYVSDLQRRVRVRGIDAPKIHTYLNLMERIGTVKLDQETRNTPTGERTRLRVALCD